MEKLPAESLKDISEEELLELAKKELLRDVKCASVRAQQFGAHGWAKPQKYMPNKRFLRHMLVNASRDNYRTDEKLKHNKSFRVTSAVSLQSKKHEDSFERNKAKKSQQMQKHESSNKRDKAQKKQSRWDPVPDDSKLIPSHKTNDKEEAFHHHHRHSAKLKKKKK